MTISVETAMVNLLGKDLLRHHLSFIRGEPRRESIASSRQVHKMILLASVSYISVNPILSSLASVAANMQKRGRVSSLEKLLHATNVITPIYKETCRL